MCKGVVHIQVVCTCTSVCGCVCRCVYRCVHTDICMKVYYMQVCLCACRCLHMCSHVCSALCIYMPPPLQLQDPSLCFPHLSPSLCSLQTVLVGDSGVGKTSLLVQFDQGKFLPHSFAATVGIGFTVSTSSATLALGLHPWGPKRTFRQRPLARAARNGAGRRNDAGGWGSRTFFHLSAEGKPRP